MSLPARIHSILVAIVLFPVTFYRRVVSPMKRAPSCRYLPTCSEYAVDAVKQRGIVVGGALAVWRVLRCNPLFRGGYDPVSGTPSAGRPVPPCHGHHCGREHI